MLVEIHFGEGGHDSRNFVHELASYYLKYATRLNLDKEILDEDDGIVTLWFKGTNVKSHFSNEGGKHIVQRIPSNGKNGKAHTSVVTVAILPLLPNIPKLNKNDFEWTAQRGHGKGGQNQNKVASAVRMIHKPTGLSVFINGRDQKQNYRRALQILSNKINELHKNNIHNSYNNQRLSQFNNRGRSSKDRTYNFIRNEVTDHNTGKCIPIWMIEKGKIELLK